MSGRVRALGIAVVVAVAVLLSVGVVAADMSSGIAHVRAVIVDFWANLWSGEPDGSLETAPDGSRTMGLRSIEDSGSGSSNVPSGVFGWLNDSIPSNSTIDTYKDARVVTVESTLNWDAVTSGTWNTFKSSVKYCSDESLRSGLRMNCGGDYGSSSYIATVTNNITSYLPDLAGSPYQETMQFIVVNFTNTTSPDKAAFVNAVAQNISEQTGNKFKIMVVEGVSGLDSAWVSESLVQYKQLTTKANWIDWEATTLRGNTTKSRIYGSNESLLDNVSDYQYDILSKMRDSHNTSDQYSETNSVKVLGGDLILYDNGTAPNTVAGAQAGYYWDIHNDTLCDNTVSFYVDDFTYIIREDSFEKIVMASNNLSALWASPAYAEALTYLGNGNVNNNWVWATANCDVKVEMWDPTFVMSNAFMLHYEWVTTAPISDYSQYEYIVVADNDSTRLTNNIGRPNNTYGYLAVGDYANTDAWLNGKKTKVDHWTDTCDVNLFLDEVDMGALGTNFSNRFKVLVDYIRNDKGKRAITNVYTEYATYSTYGDATLKESCFARWDGNIYTPTYSYGDMSLDTARASFYAEHNVSILGISFGALDDYDKLAYCAAAFAVVYGFDGNNYFRYSQPTFQTQYDISLYDYGAMLEGEFTETSSSDWNRLYAAGRVHIDPVNHTWYVEDEKVASNMSVSITMYSGGAGSGDRNVYVYVNGNTSHGTIPYNAGVDPLFTWVERTAYLNATADHVDHGHYWMYGFTRPTTGGWDYLGRHDASTFHPGLRSWFDTSAENVPATVTGQTWTFLPRDNNWMFNLSMNYTATREVDALTDRVTQSTSIAQSGSTNEYITTIASTRDIAIPVWSFEVACGVGGASSVKNATGDYVALNSGGVGWNYTTVDGKQYGVQATAGGYQYMTPNASTHVFKTTADIDPPPTPANLANTSGNFWVNHTWSAGSGNITDSYNVRINDTWHNATTIIFWNNTPLSPHGWSNISVYAFNATDGGSFSTGSASQDTQVPNNAITITNTSDWSGIVGEIVYADYDATDVDSDTPTFSCNRTDLFTDFSTTSGTGNWTADEGVYHVDFGVSDGWGSTSNYTMTIEVSAIPPAPSALANTTGNFWVNHTWSPGSGITTDSYNVSINDTWHNTTTNTFWNNTPLPPHGWSNITVYAYNASGTGTLSIGNASQDTQIPTNPITITNTSDWSGGVGSTVSVNYDATDADSDTPTFSCNRTDLFTDFDSANGTGSWTAVVGTIYVDFGVSDGWGSVDNYTMTISVLANPPAPINLANTTGNFWVNHTWQVGSGVVTDSYNISINSVWNNGTTATSNNTTYSAHAWQNITIYAWNDTACNLSTESASQDTQIPNNIPVITNTPDYLGTAGDNVYVDCDAVDADGDTLTFSCNRIDIFTDFNTATGTGNGTTLPGVYYVNFGVADVWGGADQHIMSITGDEWWNSSWAYQQRITVTSGRYEVLEDWWVEIHIDTTRCYWSDCSDLRFIDAKTHAELEYYCDNGTGTPDLTTSETLFVKAPPMPAIGSQGAIPIYIDCYWGNSNSVPTACTGAGSLHLYEDFNHGGDFPFNNWTVRDTPNGGCAIELRSAPDDYCLVMWSTLPNCYPTIPLQPITACPCSSARPALEYGMYGDKKLLVQPSQFPSLECWTGITFDVKSTVETVPEGVTLISTVAVCPRDESHPAMSFPTGAWVSGQPQTGAGFLLPVTPIHLEPGAFDVQPGTQYGPYPVWVDNIHLRYWGYAAYQPVVDYGDIVGNVSYVILYDVNQNIVQHAQATIQNTATGAITARWTDVDDGIIEFSTPGTYQIAVRTFDGVFVSTVNVTWEQVANITIPISYNVNIHPIDTEHMPILDVFCGLSEYTPLNPQAFWGFSMGSSQYVPLTNCSGFAMCDLYAEKGGYTDYEATALNWTSRSAMVKDYRHNVVLQKE